MDVLEKLMIGRAFVNCFLRFGKMYEFASGLENCNPQEYVCLSSDGNSVEKMFCKCVGEICCRRKMSVLSNVVRTSFIYVSGQ